MLDRKNLNLLTMAYVLNNANESAYRFTEGISHVAESFMICCASW
jgi:hypothetical protein